ncbi:CAAX prenyl protease-like protein [Kribbella amoyensis]|uniref:CAAX prenyl protease-like protein n=1 Tax=Kribbella amoyensis TaxID=996641 RepID=A0A561BN49_9ACTN|nr:type II CAAX endopeptidase family protein [Kribbella amoyensis]TWD80316.1 CAAX prenyl protease-like protein [Kribbella amoyensis]
MFLRVTVFYLTTFLFSGALNALQNATGPDPGLLQLVQFAPASAVGVMLLVFRRTTRVKVGRTSTTDVVRRSALAVGLVVAALLTTVVVHLLAGRSIHFGDLEFPFWALVLTMIVGAIGEELGWRSYLQPYLQTRYSVLRSSLTVGALWGLWHIGGFANGLAYMVAFVVMTTALSVILGAILRSAPRTSLPVATAAHAAVNLGLLLLFDEETDLFPMAAFATVGVVIAIATHLALRPKSRPVTTAARPAAEVPQGR